MPSLVYSIVIPTFDLPHELDRTLDGIAAQTRLPAKVIVVDASPDQRAEQVLARWQDRLPIQFQRSMARSAAQQRNLGADLANPADSPLVAFIDDDISLYPDTCAQVCEVFDRDTENKVGGVAARIEEIQRPEPVGWIWWYYRLQAGYVDRTYGGRLFGPAINCLPSYTETNDELIPADWLNSGCVFYRTAVFQREHFPRFEGISFMEDVHLSARIARTHRLYFHVRARCRHRDGATTRQRGPVAQLARMRIRNQRIVAQEVLGLRGPVFEVKLLLHRVFASISVIRRRDRGWRDELLGTWR